MFKSKKQQPDSTIINHVPKMTNSKSKGEVNVVIATPVFSNFELEESQINYENLDYINRKPYHHYDNGKLMKIN